MSISDVLQSFINKFSAHIGLVKVAGKVQIPTNIVHAVYELYGNKAQLLAQNLSIPHHPFIPNSPSITAGLSERQILKYIQWIDSIHDFGNSHAYDMVKESKTNKGGVTEKFWNFQFMKLYFILRSSFPNFPSNLSYRDDLLPQPIPQPTIHSQLLPPYGILFTPLGKFMRSVGDVEGHMLLLAIQNCHRKIDAGSGEEYLYIKKTNVADYNYDRLYEFFQDYTVNTVGGAQGTATGRIPFVIDTPGALPHILARRRPPTTGGPPPHPQPRICLLTTAENICDSCPSKSTTHSVEAIAIYDNHVYVEDPINNRVRQYVPDNSTLNVAKYNVPGNADQTIPDGHQRKFESPYVIEVGKVGWDKGNFTAIGRYITTDTHAGNVKDLGCMINDKLHPTNKPVIKENISKLSDKKFCIPISRTNPKVGTEKNLMDTLHLPLSISDIYEKFGNFYDEKIAAGGLAGNYFKQYSDAIGFNFTLKRTGDALQAEVVDYINLHKMRFIKRKTGQLKSTDTDFFEVSGTNEVESIEIDRAVFVTFDRVAAANAIYRGIPTIFTCDDGMIMYKPNINKYPRTQNIANIQIPVANLRTDATTNFNTVMGLQGLNKFGNPQWSSNPPGHHIDATHVDVAGGGKKVTKKYSGGAAVQVDTPVNSSQFPKLPLLPNRRPYLTDIQDMHMRLNDPHTCFKFLPKIISKNTQGYVLNSQKDILTKYLQNIKRELVGGKNIIKISNDLDEVLDQMVKTSHNPPDNIVIERYAEQVHKTLLYKKMLLEDAKNAKELAELMNPSLAKRQRPEIFPVTLERDIPESRIKDIEQKNVGLNPKLWDEAKKGNDDLINQEIERLNQLNSVPQENDYDMLVCYIYYIWLNTSSEHLREKQIIKHLLSTNEQLKDHTINPHDLLYFITLILHIQDYRTIPDEPKSHLLAIMKANYSNIILVLTKLLSMRKEKEPPDVTISDIVYTTQPPLHINDTLKSDYNLKTTIEEEEEEEEETHNYLYTSSDPKFVPCLYEEKYHNALLKLKIINSEFMDNYHKDTMLYFNNWHNINTQFCVTKGTDIDMLLLKYKNTTDDDMSLHDKNISITNLYDEYFNPNTSFTDFKFEDSSRFNEQFKTAAKQIIVQIFKSPEQRPQIDQLLQDVRQHLTYTDGIKRTIEDILKLKTRHNTTPDANNISEYELKEGQYIVALNNYAKSKLRDDTLNDDLRKLDNTTLHLLSKQTILTLYYQYICNHNIRVLKPEDYQIFNFNTLSAYFKMLSYYENIICIDEDEYIANYNTTYGVEIGNNLKISNMFRLLVQDFLKNPQLSIDFRYLELCIAKLDSELAYGLNYIKNCVFSYMNAETPIYNHTVEPDLHMYYFTSLVRRTNKHTETIQSWIKDNDYSKNDTINLYNNRFFATNIILHLNELHTVTINSPAGGIEIAASLPPQPTTPRSNVTGHVAAPSTPPSPFTVTGSAAAVTPSPSSSAHGSPYYSGSEADSASSSPRSVRPKTLRDIPTDQLVGVLFPPPPNSISAVEEISQELKPFDPIDKFVNAFKIINPNGEIFDMFKEIVTDEHLLPEKNKELENYTVTLYDELSKSNTKAIDNFFKNILSLIPKDKQRKYSEEIGLRISEKSGGFTKNKKTRRRKKLRRNTKYNKHLNQTLKSSRI